MSQISFLPRAVAAIEDAVAAARAIRRPEGSYDGHDVVNLLNEYRNDELNDIIDLYSNTHDPVHNATIQIGNYLKNQLGQHKIGDRVSDRKVTLRDGSRRDGRCEVSAWRI